MPRHDLYCRMRQTCLDCQERHPACHDTCEKYLEAKNNHEKIKKAIVDAKDYDIYKAKIIRETEKKNKRSNKKYSKGRWY